MPQPVAIARVGLICSVGLTASAACAAIRARISNPSQTAFVDSRGELIMAHQVTLQKAWRGLTKLTKMAAMAIQDCLADTAHRDSSRIPLLLCVAERNRPGRLDGLEDRLLTSIEAEIGEKFSVASQVVPHGRVGIAMCLDMARKLLYETDTPEVLIVAADSLLAGPTLRALENDERVLTNSNSNGFMPGEAAGALLITRVGKDPELRCIGVGFGIETARIASGKPLRADGLSQAIRYALADAACEMHDIDFRITDISGEQYYFKEAALAVSRLLRKRKTAFDIWHPADCIGECGAVSGIAIVAVADAACRKRYAIGPTILAHMAADEGPRSAAVLRFARGS